MIRLFIYLAFWNMAFAQLEHAHETILVMTQGVFEQSTEQSLKDAALKRGVKIFILCPPDLVQTPASYIPNLSLIDGVLVRRIKHSESFIVVDGQTLLDEGLEPLQGSASNLYDYFSTEWSRAEGNEYVYRPLTLSNENP